MKCTHCYSLNYWNCGFYQTKLGKKKRYKCKDCLRKFTPKNAFKFMEKSPEILNKAFDLYCESMSLRQIMRQLKKLFKVEIHYTTLWAWIQKYSWKIKNALSKIIPKKLSGLWHADEMVVKLEGEDSWMWNMIDHNSRYLIKTKISKDRKLPTIFDFLNEAKIAAGNNKPRLLITDGLQGYPRMFKKVFGTSIHSQHLRAASLRAQKNNNMVERFHGTMRQRMKTMRGIGRQSIFQGTIEILVQHYNLFKPHSSLNGKSPAQVAGIPKKYTTDWKTLIEQIEA